MFKYLICFICIFCIAVSLKISDNLGFEVNNTNRRNIMLIVGTLASILVLWHQYPGSMLCYLYWGSITAILAVGIVVSFVDYYYEEIPDSFVFFIFCLSISSYILDYLRGNRDFGLDLIVPLIVAFAGFALLAFSDSFGGGDAKYLTALIFSVPLFSVWSFLLLMAIFALCFWIVLKSTNRISSNSLPFAPAITLSYFIVFFAGEKIALF